MYKQRVAYKHLLVKLESGGDAGLPFSWIQLDQSDNNDLPVDIATGRAGDVYVCHPLLVHAASYPHRGTQARFIEQPAIVLADDEPAPLVTERTGGQTREGRRIRAIGAGSFRQPLRRVSAYDR